MAETNKSQMLSEAEIIEAINRDSLISVSLGAGQPQKNVKMSTLASVAAGLIGEANLSHRGLMPSGLYMAPELKYIDAMGTIVLGTINGILLVRDSYSWAGYNMFFCSGFYAQLIKGNPGGILFSVEYNNEDGVFILKNNSDRRRAYGVLYQNIPIVT